MQNPYFSESLMISPKADPYQINEENKYHHNIEEQLTQCPFVSQVFSIEDITGSEELRISAYGFIQCFINGQNITDDILTPGWVNYDDRLPYQTYNISNFIKKGDNTIHIWLANGWYRGALMSLQTGMKVSNVWGTKLGAIVEIRNENKILLTSNEKWQSGLLPIIKSGIYYGEAYDANITPKETDGVELLDFDPSLLIKHEIDPVQELEPIPVLEVLKDDEGHTVYDFGQNIAGYVSLELSGDKGSKILIEHSEVLGLSKKNQQENKCNHFENANFRSAAAKIEYTLNGSGNEKYKPHFTFMGFRYARIKVLSGNVNIKTITSIPISSLHEQKLQFQSSNKNVNKLIENTSWSQKANFIEVPTDCPQRDERLGWTGDAQLFSSTACYFYNCEKFFIKYLKDLVSEQDADGAIGHVSPDITRNGKTNDLRFISEEEKINGFWSHKGATGWGDAIVIIPWTLYKHYGNINVLKDCYQSMIKWCDYLWSISEGPIIRNPRYTTLSEGIKKRGFTFGDWVPPIGDDKTPNPHIGDDCYSTIYHFISTSLVAKISSILEDEKNAQLYQQRSKEIKKAFVKEFLTSSGRTAYNDQTSYAMAFANDLIPDDYKEKTKQYFKQSIIDQQHRLGTGFHGTANLLKGLRNAGLEDMIEQLLLQEHHPGWMYQIKQGATSIWERWNAMGEDGSIHDPEMNSFNHYAFGSVCEFIFENIIGIRPDEEFPGFKNIIVNPLIIPSLLPLSFRHKSTRGLIKVDINIINRQVTMSIDIPHGSTGKLYLEKYHNIVINNVTQENNSLNSGSHIIKFSI